MHVQSDCKKLLINRVKTASVSVLLLFTLFVGYVLLAYAMDETYDPSRNQTSNSILESRQIGAFTQSFEPENRQIGVAGATVKIKEAWIEREWAYKDNGLVERILGKHPTEINANKSLLIRLEGDSLPKSYMRDWAFTLKKGYTGRVNEVVIIYMQDETTPVEKVFVMKSTVPFSFNDAVIVDSMVLKKASEPK